ncbi:MAG: SMP-30/gluconolactonase/LRE family protein [Comamonadaceae bacterium]|nr:SMP-30/gluconolactonase/LRE family protein [Comamonadaceae bacterium]
MFPESPRWFRDSFYCCDIDAGTLYRIGPTAPPRRIYVHGSPVSGWVRLDDGSLLVVAGLERRIVSVRAGVATTFADATGLVGWALNDLLRAPDGHCYVGAVEFNLFADPSKAGAAEPAGARCAGWSRDSRDARDRLSQRHDHPADWRIAGRRLSYRRPAGVRPQSRRVAGGPAGLGGDAGRDAGWHQPRCRGRGLGRESSPGIACTRGRRGHRRGRHGCHPRHRLHARWRRRPDVADHRVRYARPRGDPRKGPSGALFTVRVPVAGAGLPSVYGDGAVTTAQACR